MGCSNSKSTPTVDSNPNESVGQTMMKNGKAVMTDVENRLEDMKDAVHNAAANMEAKLLNSPETERADHNEIADSVISVAGSDFADIETNAGHEIPITMTLKTEKSDDDADGLINDKPSTPMPEDDDRFSGVTLRNDFDIDGHSAYESDVDCQSAYGGTIDRHSEYEGTLKSNIFEAMCNTAAEVAMQDTTDTEYEGPSSTQYNSDVSCSSTLVSRNSDRGNSKILGTSLTESDCEAEFDYSQRRFGTEGDSYGDQSQINEARRWANDDTYVRLGRQLLNELQNRSNESRGMPGILDLMKKAKSEGRNNKTVMSINADMQLTRNTQSCKWQ